MLTLAGDGPGSRTAISESLALAADHPDDRFRDNFEGTLAFAAVAEGGYDEAEERLQSILARPERTDFAARAAPSYLADCAFGRGDGALALERYLDSLERDLRLDDINNVLIQLSGVAASLVLLGRAADAARIVGGIARIGREVGWEESYAGVGPVFATLAGLPDRLSAEEWERQSGAGALLSFDELADFARSLTPDAS
jgi:hypothetical protein